MALNPTRNVIVTHLKHLPIAFDRFINEISVAGFQQQSESAGMLARAGVIEMVAGEGGVQSARTRTSRPLAKASAAVIRNVGQTEARFRRRCAAAGC
jgi:hypothetical protein